MIFGYGSNNEENRFCKNLPSTCFVLMKLLHFIQKSFRNPLLMVLLLISFVLIFIAYIFRMRYIVLKKMHRELKRNYMSMQFAVVEMKARRRAYLMVEGVLEYHDNLKRLEEDRKPSSSSQEKKVVAVPPSKKKPIIPPSRKVAPPPPLARPQRKMPIALAGQSQPQLPQPSQSQPSSFSSPSALPLPLRLPLANQTSSESVKNPKTKKISPPKLKVCPSKTLQWKYVKKTSHRRKGD